MKKHLPSRARFKKFCDTYFEAHERKPVMVEPLLYDNPLVKAMNMETITVFILLHSFCDSNGRLPFRPKKLRSIVEAFSKLSQEKFESYLAELFNVGLLLVYEFEDERILQIMPYLTEINWLFDAENMTFPNPPQLLVENTKKVHRAALAKVGH